MMAGDGSSLQETLIEMKLATEATSNDETLNDDDTLVLSIIANAKYIWEVWANYSAGAGGARFAMHGPVGFTQLQYSATIITTGAVVVQVNAGGYDIPVLLAGASTGQIIIRGGVQNGATAGNLAFRWAQQASNAAATNVQRNSFFKLLRIR
jgi:hypothetical protein